MASFEYFANDRFKLLHFLKENEIQIKDNIYVSLSQQEIADGVGFSKLKTNKLISELKETGCLISYQNKNGKYQITSKGYNVITTICGSEGKPDGKV